ncbi:MAG: hypothetical protein QOF49_2279, partial [Chloroflexota bacterium]|nr:hypothetical protein [Chloroflexota bacterium]
MTSLLRGSPSARLDEAFRHAIAAGAGARGEPPLIGVEHEFRVSLAGRAVDARQIIHRLPIDGLRLDAADRDAYRLRSGAAITADGREAEIAIAPVELGPWSASLATARARNARAELAAALGPEAALEGYSTHISISVPDRIVERVARSYAERFAPAMLLFVDGPASPGLLVRPRPGRLELGGDFVDGDRLRIALTFALGSVLAVVAAERGRLRRRQQLPDRLSLTIEPARERFGWFVAGTAAGGDLHRDGRSAALTTRDGRRLTGQAHLAATWRAARGRLVGRVLDDDLALVDAVVRGSAPLAVEARGEGTVA